MKKAPTVRVVTDADLRLSYKEMKDFLHNAQLALCDAVSDDAIKQKLFLQKEALVHIYDHSILTPAEIALILVSAAWDIFTDTIMKEKK